MAHSSSWKLLFNVLLLFVVISTRSGVQCLPTNASATVIPETENRIITHEDLLKRYEIYRTRLGCDVDICNERNTTFNASDNFTFSKTSCSSCSCDALCERRGDCCPDRLTSFPEAGRYPLGGVFKCIPSTLKLHPYFGQWSAEVIAKCDVRYDDLNVKEKCEAAKNNTLEDVTPVIHKYTKESYKNIYCAQCNNIDADKIEPWRVRVQCHNGTVLFPISESRLVSDIRHSNTCNMAFKPPTGYPVPYCTSGQPISECNTTGSWDRYDPLVEAACSAYTSNFFSNLRNIFCYVCNCPNDYLDWCYIHRPKFMPSELAVTFAALFDFRPAQKSPREITAQSDCPSGMVYDRYKKLCRKLHCSNMTELYNGNCVRRIYAVRGLCILAWIRVDMSEVVYAGEIEDELLAHFMKLASKCKSKDKHVTLYFKHKQITDLDVNKEEVIEYFIIRIQFNDDLDFIDTLANLDGTQLAINTTTNYINVQLAVYDLMADSMNHVSAGFDPPVEVLLPYGLEPSHTCSYNATEAPLLVTKFLVCPMVHLNLSEFSIVKRSTGIFFTISNHHLMHRDYLRLTGNEIAVCVADYIPITDKNSDLRKRNIDHPGDQFLSHPNHYIDIRSILSLTCVCASVLCLLITLSVYMFLPSLRNQPGVNNMCLALSLLGALTLFQFVAGQDLHELPCSIIGLAIHFLWLISIFWMNICCYHMFITFGSMTTSTHKVSFKTTLKYNAYCFVLSSVFVMVNVIWSLSTTVSRSIGYGKRAGICYIQSALMIAYTMVLPAGLAVVSNIVMYVVVVYRIGRNSMASAIRNRNSDYFIVYIKLTSITGIVWLSYIPLYLTKHVVFEIIYTFLLTSQGVFIMLAFICNKRIFEMLKRKLKGEHSDGSSKYAPSSEITGNSTVNVVSSGSMHGK